MADRIVIVTLSSPLLLQMFLAVTGLLRDYFVSFFISMDTSICFFTDLEDDGF